MAEQAESGCGGSCPFNSRPPDGLIGIRPPLEASPRSAASLCGIGLCFGYTLLGAGRLVLKREGSLRNRSYTRLRPLTIGVFGFLAIAFVYALALNFRIMDRGLEWPYLLVFPALGAVTAVLLVRGIKIGAIVSRSAWRR